MIYSYTQISQYLRCPRSYRYRYLDGWREKDTRAAMVFGRAFEKALGAYFEQQDPTAALFKEWAAFRDASFEYRKGESWDRLLHQGVHLLEKFVREDRVRVPHAKENLQLKITQPLAGGNDFVSYVDAILPDRLENYEQPLFGTARRASVPRSTAHLLLLDQWHS